MILQAKGRFVVTLLAIVAAFVAFVAVPGVLLVRGEGGHDVPVAEPPPGRAEVSRRCRAAVESDAERRSAESGGPVSTVAGIDLTEPVWAAGHWTVDATVRFTIVSELGLVPVTVFVTCATGAGSDQAWVTSR